MTLFELYLWIAGVLGAFAATALAVRSALIVLDLSPFIPAGALRHRPPAN